MDIFSKCWYSMVPFLGQWGENTFLTLPPGSFFALHSESSWIHDSTTHAGKWRFCSCNIRIHKFQTFIKKFQLGAALELNGIKYAWAVENPGI